MPARIASSTGTARGSTSIPNKAATVSRSRPVKSAAENSKDDVKGKRVAPLDEKVDKGNRSEDKGEVILSAIKSTKSCNQMTVDRLANLLGTSTLNGETSTSVASSSKLKLSAKVSSASLHQASKESKASTKVDVALNDPKRAHLAKLVVNAVIASLNDRIGSGWKLEVSTPGTSERTSSRSTSASSTSSSSNITLEARATKSIPQSLHTRLTTPTVEANVTCIFNCARVAIHYLISEEKKGCLPKVKEFELEFIMSSLIRKLVAMNLHCLAALELNWLHNEVVQKYTSTNTGRSFEYSIPNTIITFRLCDLILEVQTLSLTCALFQSTTSQMTELLSAVIRHPGGPLSWQHYVRTSFSEEAKETADRHAYSVERAITKYLAKYAKTPSGMDADLVLQCRKISLDFLLFVSDLDQDAFWDRAARVGSSYMRSKISNEVVSAQDKKAAFLIVDEVLRDLVRRAEQVQNDFSSSSSSTSPIQKLQGKGFSSFCESWIQLAQRAGEAQAIHHIAGLLIRNQDNVSGTQPLSEEQVDGLITQLCARLSQTIAAVGGMSEGDIEMSIFKNAEVEVNAGLRLANLSSTEGLQKLFKVLDQLRRRVMRLVDEKKVKSDDATTLLLAICKHYEQYLECDGTMQLEDDEAVLDDCIYVLRTLANNQFVVSDWTTHEVSATYLTRCDSLLNLNQGKMKNISSAVRCNKMRLLSSSWYYIGGQLYNDKKLPLAIRFLKLACESAQTSVELYNTISDKAETTNGELIKRPEGLAKKWEHLAVSYRHSGQARPSYEAFINALHCTEEKTWKSIADEVSKRAIGEVLSPSDQHSGSDKSISDVALVAKACFEIATFDLLLYHKLEEDWVHQLLEKEFERASIAALLEYCLSTLDNTMHREEAPQAALYLVERLLSIYDPLKMPIRRARVLLRKLELAVMQPQLTIEKHEVLEIVQEIESLLNQKELADDTNLAHYTSQYKAMLSILQILYERESASPCDQSKDLLFASQASAHLKNILSCTSIKVYRPLKTLDAPKQYTVDIQPITPPQKKGSRRLGEVAIKAVGKVDSQPYFDNAARLCSFVELAAEVLSSRSNLFASIELLMINKQVAEALRDNLGPNYYLQYSASLIKSFLQLGLIARVVPIVKEVDDAIKKDKHISADTEFKCLLAIADFHCYNGQVEKSEGLYHAAVRIASNIEAEGRMSSLHSSLHRCHTHERQSYAAEAISWIHFAKGDLAAAIRYAVLSVRSAMKAGLVLSRLTCTINSDGQDLSPFNKQEKVDAEEAFVSKNAPLPRLNSLSVATIYWRMTRTLYLAYLKVARLHKIRGSARDAEGFMGEAIDFASSVYMPRLLASAMIERGSIRLQMGNLDKGKADLNTAVETIDKDGYSWEALKYVLVKVEEHSRTTQIQAALDCCQRADSILDTLTVQLKNNGFMSSPVKSKKGLKGDNSMGKYEMKDDMLLPQVRGKLSQEQAWLLILSGREEEGRELMDRAAILLQRGSDKDEQSFYQARIQIYQSMSLLKADPIMDMLPESAISVPMIELGSNNRSSQSLIRGTITKTAISRLELAHSLLEGVIKGKVRNSMDSIILRKACAHTVSSQVLLSVLLGQQIKSPESIAILQESTSALTMQREMQDAIISKQEVKGTSMSIPGWQLSSQESAIQKKGASSEVESSEDEPQEEAFLKQRWSQISKRHQDLKPEMVLPHNWTVISISFQRERNCLVLSRRCGDVLSPPIVFYLPVDRQSRREGEEETVSVEVILEELKSIINQSNVATHSAQHLEGLQARKEWWTMRRELDSQLKELLTSIEVNWLGAFKSLLIPRPVVSIEDMASLRDSFNGIFQRAFFSNSTASKRISQVGLDDGILDCFSGLSLTTFADEELEDLIHFVMDAFQFHGMPVAVDEVDMDLCVTELRSVLEVFRVKHQDDQGNEDRHVFLILDKDTCAIPWESLPLLRNQAVCRIPSLSFLEDRLEQTREQGTPGRFCVEADRAKVWYLLNPSKDLTRTQERFLPWLEKQSKRWTGIVNRAPVIEEMAEALESNDIVLYFGHGGGEQYIRPSKLRSLKKCAITMLWGCSSGILKDLGEFDRSGTPYNYLMAGCPSLLGNLWDATDKELDGISESVLEKMGLKQGKEKQEKIHHHRLSIAQAVAQSRDACKLPYLTGAACVVYGIPVYYQ